MPRLTGTSVETKIWALHRHNVEDVGGIEFEFKSPFFSAEFQLDDYVAKVTTVRLHCAFS